MHEIKTKHKIKNCNVVLFLMANSRC